uniref:Uncharacterized protein n=1 Tax=Arcella intermedia TaxID=1963864 RepID=A0A6B2LUL6_9EUKA
MVDSRDRSRMSEARHELHCLVADLDLTNIPILILANKQDLPSMSVHEVAYALRLRHIRDRDWCIKWCSIIHRAGLYDGLDWLSNLLS